MPGFPPLPDNFEPTRATLHRYALAVGAIPRAHAEPHDKWWHVSLNIVPSGLETNEMATPDGRSFRLRMDLTTHEVELGVAGEGSVRIDMQSGLTGTQMGDALIGAVAALGLEGEYNREKFESDDPRSYDPAAAAAFNEIINGMQSVFTEHRSTIGGSVSPIQLWPHNFDMAFEWFGTRVEEYEEHGKLEQFPAQCNFGFYPGGEAYLYANPWPFEAEVLLPVDLPPGASWHTEGWQGSMLPFAEIAGTEDGADRILQFFGTVFEHAAPTLTA